MLRYFDDVFMGTCKMLITLFLCLDGWVVGWVVFHHFQVLFLLIFLYWCKSINNVGGQHRWLFAFLAACYELTLILCFSCLILWLFVANKLLLLLLLRFEMSSDCWEICKKILWRHFSAAPYTGSLTNNTLLKMYRSMVSIISKTIK